MKPNPRSRPDPAQKQHVSAVIFTIGDFGYAWVGHAMKLDAWEKEPIVCGPGAGDWNAAAFIACLTAYGRLRKRLPTVDMSLSITEPSAGQALPLTMIAGATMRTLRRLIPELRPPMREPGR
jgi:hypothetical protein